MRAAAVVWGCVLLTAGLRAAPPATAKLPAPFSHTRIGVANGCFVESVAFGDDLRARQGEGAWYRLLQWGAKDSDEVVAGHAVVVFEHRGTVWSYDINHGFTPLEVTPAEKENVELVAKQATAPYVGRITPRYPIYREDFPAEPDPRPPVMSDAVEERDLRDAALVAVRLAKHRPVTLVEFDYPKEGVTRRGAAVAFVYNGRLCVYSPPAGTVPFRARALSVDNLRQLQEMLRRIHPGANNLMVR